VKTDTGILARIQPTLKRLSASARTAFSPSNAQTTLLPPSWRNKLNKPSHQTLLTPEQIEVRVWAAVVIAVTLILFGVVFALLYSVTFVTQPIKSMAPIDQAYTKMLNDIVLLIVGGIGGVMSRKGVQGIAEKFGTPATPPTPQYTPAPVQPAPTGMPNFNWMGYQNPELDESWRPGPPPTTPPNYDHPEREEIAQERLAARGEA
jgi:hypothetical protein